MTINGKLNNLSRLGSARLGSARLGVTLHDLPVGGVVFVALLSFDSAQRTLFGTPPAKHTNNDIRSPIPASPKVEEPGVYLEQLWHSCV